jgi:PAS domain-containing protein
MASQDLPMLLRRWRDAETQWAQTPIHDDAIGRLRRSVIEAWRDYNAAAGTFGEDEIVLLADDTMTYVAVFGPTERVLGWASDALVGQPIAAVTPPDSVDLMAAAWAEFTSRGELEGQYPLLARDGSRVMTQFRARAHQPLPGAHLSRHWIVAAPSE